ncbi:hypothetical protein [Guptibacillus hwajinpoensis]|uniref:hypothetical protein n=1 Tax=Guptibacillus hwajinpoensis TaxID=208199 RepID=UPI0024B35DDF|nr:hypothetical protein [Pseudalkalibacillus hwajinpoensis]
MKKIRTWDNSGETVDLIGRKKVDWSIFEFGSTIPQGFHEEFVIANNNIVLKRGEKKEVHLITAETEYSAKLINVDRKDVPADSLQIRYDQNKELKELLKSVFYSSYNLLSEIDYSQEILPPSPSFLPQFAKEFTRQRQHIYQWIRKPYRLTI